MEAYSWIKRSVSKLKNTSLPFTATAAVDNSNKKSSKNYSKEEESEKVYGIIDQLIVFIKSFSLETFTGFSLPDEEGISGDDGSWGNLRQDLSDWHAMLVLKRVKVLIQLRFQLCPRRLKERQFWRIYFKLVKSYLIEYELRAVQLAKLKQRSLEMKLSLTALAMKLKCLKQNSRPRSRVPLDRSETL